MSEEADFGDEAGDDLIGKETGSTHGAWSKELTIKVTRMTKTKVGEEVITVKNAKRRKKKTNKEEGREVSVADFEDEEVSS